MQMDPGLSRLQESVKGLIKQGRVGDPAVVRWYMRTPATRHRTPDALSEAMTTIAGDWMGGPAISANVVRSGKELVTHLAYGSGGFAIVTAAIGPGEPANDLMVFGSRGAIYHGRTPEGGSL